MGSIYGLDGKVALITGATRGIGWACAQILSECGMSLIITGCNKELLEERATVLRNNLGTQVEVCQGDVGDPNIVKACFTDIYRKFKRLDVLVNNAGIHEGGILGMITKENVENVFHVNVLGMILNMQYASRLMSRNNSGSIINISSIMGRYGCSGQVVYGGSKAAVIGATLSAAKELAANNVRVNAIAPGFIDTDMVHGLSAEKFEARMASIKMGRIGTPEDVAKAVLFFASDLSAYVTGQVLGVDGGMLV